MKKKVLLIDANPQTRVTTSEGLRLRDYEVEIAKSGLEALEKIPNSSPDIILLDTKLPDLSGYEVLQMIKTDQNISDIPVIAFSSGKIGEEDKLLRFGASEVIAKPFETKEAADRIEKVIEKRRLI